VCLQPFVILHPMGTRQQFATKNLCSNTRTDASGKKRPSA
jgi:hypothetical protein